MKKNQTVMIPYHTQGKMEREKKAKPEQKDKTETKEKIRKNSRRSSFRKFRLDKNQRNN